MERCTKNYSGVIDKYWKIFEYFLYTENLAKNETTNNVFLIVLKAYFENCNFISKKFENDTTIYFEKIIKIFIVITETEVRTSSINSSFSSLLNAI